MADVDGFGLAALLCERRWEPAMRDLDFYQQALDLDKPWRVVGSEFGAGAFGEEAHRPRRAVLRT